MTRQACNQFSNMFMPANVHCFVCKTSALLSQNQCTYVTKNHDDVTPVEKIEPSP